MHIYLIRHGATKGNREGRYVGCTDEDILLEEQRRLEDCSVKGQSWLSKVRRVYVSPLKRCQQTAECLFGRYDVPIERIEGFRECDFGRFEYCSYEELNGNPAYQQFIDSMGSSGFPEGEHPEVFKKRCAEAFCSLYRELTLVETAALVVHGGTIMALLDAYSVPHGDYYSWQCKNTEGYEADVIWENGIPCFSNIRKLVL